MFDSNQAELNTKYEFFKPDFTLNKLFIDDDLSKVLANSQSIADRIKQYRNSTYKWPNYMVIILNHYLFFIN